MRIESFLSLFLAWICVVAAAASPAVSGVGEVPARKMWDEARARHEGPGPVLWIRFPSNETSFHYPAIRYAGCVERDAKVTLNGVPLRVYPSGAFAGRFALKPGTNRLEFCAARRGHTTKIARKIERRPRPLKAPSPSGPRVAAKSPAAQTTATLDGATTNGLNALNSSDRQTSLALTFWQTGLDRNASSNPSYDSPSSGTLRGKSRPRLKERGPLGGLTICVDPGHGGRDTGAIGSAGLCESDANLAIARRLARLLKRHGAYATLTREDDAYLSIEERFACAQRVGADLFLTIHNNDVSLQEDPLVLRGARFFYFHDFSEEPARHLAEACDAIQDGYVQRVSHIRRTYRLTSTLSEAPSVLAECAYLSHPEDEMRLLDPAFLDSLAEALYKGIDAFFNSPSIQIELTDRSGASGAVGGREHR